MNHSSLRPAEERIKTHQDEIHNLFYTIKELKILKYDREQKRSDKYCEMFTHISEDKDLAIDYFKRCLTLTSLSSELLEIDRIIEILQERINKEYEYIKRIEGKGDETHELIEEE